MHIQLITTREEIQEMFNGFHEKSLLNYRPESIIQAPVILTGEELADKLGITVQTLIKWKHKGKIPHLQIGPSIIRYDFNAVLKALEVDPKRRK